MANNVYKKYLVVFIIILFVGVSIYPGASVNVKETASNNYNSNSGPPEEEWNATYGGITADEGQSIMQTGDGGYVICGYTTSYGAGNIDAWLIKTDIDGNEQWNQTYGGGEIDSGESVQQTSDGGYIIGGLTHSFDVGNHDFWLIKTDANGNEQWNQTYGGGLGESGGLAQVTNDDGYVIVGATFSYGAGSSDAWLVKTDTSGNEQWNQTYGGLEQDWGRLVQQTNDNGQRAMEPNLWGKRG
jgi:hypothetical protein